MKIKINLIMPFSFNKKEKIVEKTILRKECEEK